VARDTLELRYRELPRDGVRIVPIRRRKPRRPQEESYGQWSIWTIPWDTDLSATVTLPRQSLPYRLDRVCVVVDPGGPAVQLAATALDGAGQPTAKVWTEYTLGSGAAQTLTLSPDLALAVESSAAAAVGPLPREMIILPTMTVRLNLLGGPFPGGSVSSCTAFLFHPLFPVT